MCKERPILFSGPMVQAILEGRKTQTRRVMKPQPELKPGTTRTPMDRQINTAYWHWRDEWWWQDPQRSMIAKCPYGQPGDRLWVRETWGTFGMDDIRPSEFAINGVRICYQADDDPESWRIERWRPSIHIPRWASRINLKVTGVRVERVQDITEADAVAEGISPDLYDLLKLDQGGTDKDVAVNAFKKLWDSINAKRGYSWDSNPWVWVVEFEKY